jgi:hypothetical protein
MVATPIVIASTGTNSMPKKSAAGRPARDRVEHDEPRARRRARARLVEADVTGLADAEDLEVDAAGFANRTLVLVRVRFDVAARHVAARQVHVLGRDVDVLEQVLPHEPVVAVHAVGRHGVVLVEVEGHDVGEIEPFLAVHADQLAVDADRRRARGEPQHRALARATAVTHDLGDARGDPTRDRLVVFGDDDGQPLESCERLQPLARANQLVESPADRRRDVRAIPGAFHAAGIGRVSSSPQPARRG